MDDLLDLDFASAPAKAPAAAQGHTNPQARYGSGRTAFDYLAQSSAAPSYKPNAAVSSNLQPRPAPPSQPPASTGGDAFASLFGTSNSQPGVAARVQPLSMQERLQRDSAVKIGGLGAGPLRSGPSPSNGGLGSGRLGGPSPSSAPLQPTRRVPSPSAPALSPTSRTASPAGGTVAPLAPKASAEVWDLDMLSASVPTTSPSPTSVPSAPRAASAPVALDDPFDLGFDPPVSRVVPASLSNASPAPDEFDLLDAFAAPASRLRVSPSSASPAASAPVSPTSAASDPPPHILGQLVEMGFAPSSAVAALVASRASPTAPGLDDGWNLDAALEALVNAQHAEGLNGRDADEWGEEDNVRIGRRRSWERDDDDAAEMAKLDEARRRAAQRAGDARHRPEETGTGVADGPSGRARASTARPRARPGESSPAGAQDPVEFAREQAKVLQEQAGEMLAQAQKIGFSMFKSANAYWGEGKKVLAKKLEEQRAATAGGATATGGRRTATSDEATGAQGGNGRPKWWTDEMVREEREARSAAANGAEESRSRATASTGFKDDDEEVLPARPFVNPSAVPERARRVEPEAPQATSEYRSPFRRGGKPASAPPPVAEADLASSASASNPPQSTSRPSGANSRTSPSPAPPPTPRRAVSRRPYVPVSASAISSAQKHKTAGNEHFKLGRFGEAAVSYTQALDALPEAWLGRVPLLNNRAQARLRSGEEKSAAQDCSEALRILSEGGDGGAGTREEIELAALEADGAVIPNEVMALYAGAPLDLKDQLGKALGRRAKALEALEKWSSARDDWERVQRLGDEAVLRGAGGPKLVSDGVARCRKVLDPAVPDAGSTSRAATPATAARPPRVSPATATRPKARTAMEGSGEAVRALQAQQAAAAAEDLERHALKDSVDERIAAWKGGKETNLRALIASLDAVLWPELGWKTVGMHELISESQLKVRYVRAIAKVHPDKLNVNNTTVEQRMIAALVFAALNDAWNGMKG